MSDNQDAKYRVHSEGDGSVLISGEVLSKLDMVATGTHTYHLLWQGKSYHLEVVDLEVDAKRLSLRANGRLYHLTIDDSLDLLIERLGLQRHRSTALEQLRAPMPGLVLKLLVQPGDEVQTGDPIVILEAMKMENIIKATGQGIVDKLHVNEGQPVEKEAILMTFK